MITTGIAHLPTWLQESLRLQKSVHVEFEKSHFVSVYPQQRLFASNIQNWDQQFFRSGNELRFSVPVDSPSVVAAAPLPELLWRMTFHAVEVAPLDDVQFRVFHLASWPTIAHMPEDIQLTVARICALLSFRQSNASLIPKILDLEKELTLKVLKALQLAGYIHAATAAVPDPPPCAAVQANLHEPASDATAPLPRTFMDRLWHRLSK